MISPTPLTSIVPIQRKGDDAEVVTQFEMHAIEQLGLLKMDFLGLRNLTTIERCLDLIADNTGARPDIDGVALDDKQVYDMLSRGDGMGVFQLEGSGMRSLMRGLRPDRFQDLMALISLYRPGPLGAGTHLLYADRKNGRARTEYPHVALESVLSETYGIMVYQEQVMQSAQVMAGFSLAEADTLRKAMGKKIPAVMAQQEESFLAGCLAQGYPRELARSIFALMSHFAGYGFNKPHAAGYALVAYQTAWLKVHHPAEYMAALLTSSKLDKDRTAVYLSECRTMGVRVLVPDVNLSESDFVARNGAIPFGLSAIRNVGEGVVELITEERRKNGVFASFQDFVNRVDIAVLNKRTIESLIKAGAFDTTGASRKGLTVEFDEMTEAAIAASRRGHGPVLPVRSRRNRRREPASSRSHPPSGTRRSNSDSSARCSASTSRITRCSASRASCALARTSIAALDEAADGSTVTVGGIVAGVTRRYTRSGEPMLYFSLEDLEASVEVVCFSAGRGGEGTLRP